MKTEREGRTGTGGERKKKTELEKRGREEKGRKTEVIKMIREIERDRKKMRKIEGERKRE